MTDQIQTPDALVEKLEAAQRTYYNNTGEYTINDAEYDALEDSLRKADPNNAFFTSVGAAAPVAGAWPKAKHGIPMGSLNKAQNTDDLTKWFASCVPWSRCGVMVTEKLDGISIELRYENRELVQGVTRGDGETGEDITRNVLLMKGAIKMLPAQWQDGTPVPDLVFVRGEIICLKSDFAQHFKGESNPRNTASGTSKRRSNHEKCRYLTIKTYQLLPDGVAPPTKTIEMTNLEHAGFQVSNWDWTHGVQSTVESVYREYVDGKRDALDYDIDGLVVEVDETSVREGLGELHHRPKGAVAFKFPHEEKPTVLRNVRWQVGNSGRVTPVAEFDVVSLVGANVRQASLHNISNIKRLIDESPDAGTTDPPKTALWGGDHIMVARRNDVIPYVEGIIRFSHGSACQEFSVPTECPSCKGTLERDGEYLVCRNDDCEAQATGAIKRWVKKIGVLHVGETLIEALVEAGMVTDPADLYTLNQVDVEDLDMGGRRVGGTGTKAIHNLEAKMTLPLHAIVGSLGIDMIGRTTAKTIIDGGFDSLSKLLKARISEIAAIPGVGQTKATNFVHGFMAKAGLVAKLLSNGIRIQDVSGPLVGQSFCLTGFRDPALQDAIEKAGGTIKSGVSKALTTLVAFDPSSTSGKAKKAAKYNIDIIGQDDAWNLVGGKP